MGCDRFRKQYAAYAARTGVTSGVEHRSGKTIRIVDPVTGDGSGAYLFVGVLLNGRYASVEPTPDMGQNAWLRCHVAMHERFGGSTPRLACDSLRTGVVSHPREGEAVLDDAYRSMAEHHSAAVIPGRVRRPKDKPSAENTAWHATMALAGVMRDRSFGSLDELLAAVRAWLDECNSRPFRKRDGSRRSMFESEERPLPTPLPETAYEVADWIYGRKAQRHAEVVGLAVGNAHGGYTDAKIQRLVERAGPRHPQADLRPIDRGVIAGLDAGNYLGRRLNVASQGATGSGRSFLLCALAESACRGRYRACHVRMPDLVEQVEAAALKPGGPAKLVRKHSAYTLLAIDEWLVDKPDERFRRFLLELMELRYGNAGTAFATQLATRERHSRPGGDAILDRIVHDTVWIDTGEFNMRQRHGRPMLES